MKPHNSCPICKTEKEVISQADYAQSTVFYVCPVCGRFQLGAFGFVPKDNIDENHLASYLFYHSHNHQNSSEYRYHTVLDKETCDAYKADFERGVYQHGLPVHMNAEIVENWYPKTFSERIDYILLYLNAHIPHIGQQFIFSYQELLSLLFIDRKEYKNGKAEWRDAEFCEEELEYMLQYLRDSSYISYTDGSSEDDYVSLRLTPNGYSRIDALQKNTFSGRNVLVAMKFGDDTKLLREAIRKGVTDAGYIAIFIDEVQHNDFITPELLKYIRDSKFVVVDLTHQNNGAYFEEGYAMGLGKPVIQLCQIETKLHFDIAQKNSIMWQIEDDIPQKLCNRIKATID